MRISFNDKAIKKMSKKAFLKQFAHLKKYVDLEAYFDSLKAKKNVKRDSK